MKVRNELGGPAAKRRRSWIIEAYACDQQRCLAAQQLTKNRAQPMPSRNMKEFVKKREDGVHDRRHK